jgi:hypothetical protein
MICSSTLLELKIYEHERTYHRRSTEQLNRWEELLGSMNVDQITTPIGLRIGRSKITSPHLMAGNDVLSPASKLPLGRPVFPTWIQESPDAEGNTVPTNSWIYATYRDQPWSIVHQSWKGGFLRFLELGEWISERDLLDASRYPWLDGRPLAFILLASYDHHQEHLDKLIASLDEHEKS